MRIERSAGGDETFPLRRLQSYEVGVLASVPPSRNSRIGDVIVRCPDNGQGLMVLILGRQVYIDDECDSEQYRWRRLRPGERVVITEG